MDKKRLSGNQRLTRSGVKKTCSAPEMRQPNRTNGKASITIDRKIVLICNTEFGIKENIFSLLTINIICQNNIRFSLKKQGYFLPNSYLLFDKNKTS